MAMKKIVCADDLTPEQIASMEAYMAEKAEFRGGYMDLPILEVTPPHYLAPEPWRAVMPADITEVVAASLAAAGMPSEIVDPGELPLTFYTGGEFDRETDKWRDRVPEWLRPQVGFIETEAHESVVDRVVETAMASEAARAWYEAEWAPRLVDPNSPFLAQED